MQELEDLKMESLGVKEFDDYGSVGCTSHSSGDEPKENVDQWIECDGGEEEPLIVMI